jgi:hypothetical protein
MFSVVRRRGCAADLSPFTVAIALTSIVVNIIALHCKAAAIRHQATELDLHRTASLN